MVRAPNETGYFSKSNNYFLRNVEKRNENRKKRFLIWWTYVYRCDNFLSFLSSNGDIPWKQGIFIYIFLLPIPGSP